MRFGRALSPWGAFFFPFDAAFAAVRGSGAEPAGFAVARVREDERRDRGAVEEDAMGVGKLRGAGEDGRPIVGCTARVNERMAVLQTDHRFRI